MKFIELKKLKAGDKVAILSPSFAAPAAWPEVYELGIKRLKDIFGLEPVEFPTTRKLGASKEDRAADLIAAFENSEIKAIITTIGGDDQVTYVKNLPKEPFINNPKLFFGFSDNTHLANFLWLNGIPSYYGGSIMTQFATGGTMDEFNIDHLKKALFENDTFEIKSSPVFNDIVPSWSNIENLNKERVYETNEGWIWDGNMNTDGVSWGGCIESIDEILRHGLEIPTLEQFSNIVLVLETSEELPSADYVSRIIRAFGERGILEKVKAVLMGRPQACTYKILKTYEEKSEYKREQREMVLKTIRQYNKDIPVIQNLDFGHTNPQISFPYGRNVKIDSENKKIFVDF